VRYGCNSSIFPLVSLFCEWRVLCVVARVAL
jgi:hypothetical protein